MEPSLSLYRTKRLDGRRVQPAMLSSAPNSVTGEDVEPGIRGGGNLSVMGMQQPSACKQPRNDSVSGVLFPLPLNGLSVSAYIGLRQGGVFR